MQSFFNVGRGACSRRFCCSAKADKLPQSLCDSDLAPSWGSCRANARLREFIRGSLNSKLHLWGKLILHRKPNVSLASHSGEVDFAKQKTEGVKIGFCRFYRADDIRPYPMVYGKKLQTTNPDNTEIPIIGVFNVILNSLRSNITRWKRIKLNPSDSITSFYQNFILRMVWILLFSEMKSAFSE